MDPPTRSYTVSASVVCSILRRPLVTRDLQASRGLQKLATHGQRAGCGFATWRSRLDRSVSPSPEAPSLPRRPDVERVSDPLEPWAQVDQPCSLPDQEAFTTAHTFPDSARLWLAPSDATPRRWRRDRSAQTPSRGPIRKVCRPLSLLYTVGKGGPGLSLPSSPHRLALYLVQVTFPGTLLPGPFCFCCSSDLMEFSQRQTNRLMAYLSG